MKKTAYLVLAAFSLYLCGCCSLPGKVRQTELYSYTTHEKKVTAGFNKRKDIYVTDFRNKVAYEENIEDQQKAVEEYIAGRPNLSETAKDNLRKLRVTEGATKAEVEFLLGKPDKISYITSANPYTADERWIYRISKLDAVMFFIIPFSVVHEGHYLYFKEDTLVGLEKRFLRQTVQTSAGPGLYEKKLGGSGPDDEETKDDPSN